METKYEIFPFYKTKKTSFKVDHQKCAMLQRGVNSYIETITRSYRY